MVVSSIRRFPFPLLSVIQNPRHAPRGKLRRFCILALHFGRDDRHSCNSFKPRLQATFSYVQKEYHPQNVQRLFVIARGGLCSPFCAISALCLLGSASTMYPLLCD